MISLLDALWMPIKTEQIDRLGVKGVLATCLTYFKG